MYGKNCLGCQVASISDLWVLATKVGRELATSSIYPPQIDTMALQIIAYWPHFAYEDEPDKAC